MLEKLSKNRILLITIIVVVIILIIVSGVLIKHGLQEGVNTGTDKGSEGRQEQDEPYGGDGLGVGDAGDRVDSIDGSGSWKESDELQNQTDDCSDKETDNETDKTKNSADNNADDKAENDDPDNKNSEGLEEDILEENDKTWGEIS